VRFLVDAQLPPALASKLESQGHRAEHVADQGMTSASDSTIWEYASTVGAVIVTKDEDFAIRRLLSEGPAIVWLRMGNSRRVALLDRVEAELPAIVAALERGEKLIEVI
jgi:predicted nuclease of predicted toxin-antitoxin system